MQPLTSPADHDSRYHNILDSDETSPSPDEYTPLLTAHRNNRERYRIVSLFFIIFMFLTLVFGIIIGIYLLNEQDRVWPLSAPYELIPRWDWGAKYPNGAVVKIPIGRRADYIILTHSGTKGCDNFSECKIILKEMQNLYQNPPYNKSDLPFNFLIGNDAKTYEGRGWLVEGEVDPMKNDKSISVALIGNFTDTYPTSYHLEELQSFISEALRRRRLEYNYGIIGRAFNGTPVKLFSTLKKWSHWCND